MRQSLVDDVSIVTVMLEESSRADEELNEWTFFPRDMLCGPLLKSYVKIF